MQTFLAYPDHAASAAVLDRQRLGRQRVEVLQILRALAGTRRGWRRHPAVVMWRGARQQLVAYGLAVCAEWVRRGYRDRVAAKLRRFGRPGGPLPRWWGGPLHTTHRAALLAKAPEHYAQFGWDETPKIDYYWPVPMAPQEAP